MNEYETPYDVYQTRGYSAKQTIATILGGGVTLGIVLIAAFVVVRLMLALDEETLRTFALVFFGILFAGLSTAVSLAIVTVFRYIQKPGVQMPGILGKLEEALEERK